MGRTERRHLVLVESYDGIVETTSAAPEERRLARGLGLPLDDIADRLDCRITVLVWDDWLRYEQDRRAFLHWPRPPATRPAVAPGPAPERHYGPSVRCQAIPVRDPDHGMPLALFAPSPRLRGLAADSDPLLCLSFILDQYLSELHASDPMDALLLPVWGGLGFITQMARATGCNRLGGVPIAAVVTDPSALRQAVNGEGLWTRAAVTRRQTEDLSLGLADMALTFGPRGDRTARQGRLPDAPPPHLTVRWIPSETIDSIQHAAHADSPGDPAFFLDEPWQAAAGVLTALDAAASGRTAALRCAGTDMAFAPMAPRSFADYWSSRGFVRTTIGDGRWTWGERPTRQADRLPVRLFPSPWEHLPDVWSELACGSIVLLSDAAAEGIAPGSTVPDPLRIAGEPTAGDLTCAIDRVSRMDPRELDGHRRALCHIVIEAHRGEAKKERIATLAAALDELMAGRVPVQDLGRVATLLLDRRRPLADITSADAAPATAGANDRPATLSVVIPCHEMGDMVRQTVESVWASTRQPDEVLLVDDGSQQAATLDTVAALERVAVERGLPLQVIRQANRGLPAARNTGLAAATGQFISFLDGDDLIEPDFYALAAATLKRYPRLGGVAAWADIFGHGVPPMFWNAPQPELPLLLVENTVIVPCMMRTDVVRSLGGADETQRYNYEDWELSVRMLAAGHPIVTLPRYLQRCRARPDSLLRTMTPAQNQIMRERMLTRHRALVERFAVEIALLLDGRCMVERLEREHLEKRAPAPIWRRVARWARARLRIAAQEAARAAMRTRRPPNCQGSGG